MKRVRRPGRPKKPERRARPGGRSARVRESVLQATMAVLQDKGFQELTIADVAARAGVHETSIYRRWGSKDAVVLEAFVHVAETAFAVPDTGALRSDLVALMESLIALLRSPQGQAMLALTRSSQNHVVGTRRAFWRRRFDLLKPMFDKAAARGELTPPIDAGIFLETLIAPLYLRALMTGEPIEDWPYRESIDRLLLAYGAPPIDT
jgi:AcrR family transcriptional regulator